MSHKIPIEVRNLVMERIKVDGINANCAATEAGLSPKTVYGWLAKETHKS